MSTCQTVPDGAKRAMPAPLLLRISSPVALIRKARKSNYDLRSEKEKLSLIFDMVLTKEIIQQVKNSSVLFTTVVWT